MEVSVNGAHCVLSLFDPAFYKPYHVCMSTFAWQVKMAELTGHTSRVLHLAQSPDGETVLEIVTATYLQRSLHTVCGYSAAHILIATGGFGCCGRDTAVLESVRTSQAQVKDASTRW